MSVVYTGPKHHPKGFATDVYVDNIAGNPYCDHGPTILFERILANGVRKKFYACSACRDQKLCGFYLDADEMDLFKPTLSKASQIREQDEFLKYHLQRYKKCKNVIEKCPVKKVSFCITCSDIILQKSILKSHKECSLINELSEKQWKFPCQILPPQSNSKSTAQYLFAEKSINTIHCLLKALKVTKVICIGTPKIHEVLCEDSSCSSLLLDLDQRFSCFFPITESLTYNLFNHYFYGGTKAEEIYSKFLEKANGKLAVIMDPPFGGRMELISNTLRIIQNEWKFRNEISDEEKLPIILAFPYFLEKQVLANLPEFTMLDYQVDYQNHDIYTTGPKGMKHGSAVRLFVNLPPDLFPLPEDQGYWYCVICCRWVYEKNYHCDLCGSCTSKDGRTYKHCKICKKCVKPSWIHCQKCAVCAPVSHVCNTVSKAKKEFSCHSCGEEGHKRRDCQKRKLPETNKMSKKRRNIIPQSRLEERSRDLEILTQIIRK